MRRYMPCKLPPTRKEDMLYTAIITSATLDCQTTVEADGPVEAALKVARQHRVRTFHVAIVEADIAAAMDPPLGVCSLPRYV